MVVMNHTSTNKNLMAGIKFALNFPVDVELLHYDANKMGSWKNVKGIYKVRVMEDGMWHHFELDAPFVHNCMKACSRYEGYFAKWIAPIKYEDIFI
jgi:hypothetical protein